MMDQAVCASVSMTLIKNMFQEIKGINLRDVDAVHNFVNLNIEKTKDTIT